MRQEVTMGTTGYSKNSGTGLTKQINKLKQQKMASQKIVYLSDFRETNSLIEAKNILVVDDDDIMRSALKRILESQNFKVTLAEDGITLSKHLETSKFDLILLDINLPWVDGFELCSLIKEHVQLRKIPIIIISARSNKEDIERGFEVGAKEYITKPFEMEEILDTVNKVLLEEAI